MLQTLVLHLKPVKNNNFSDILTCKKKKKSYIEKQGKGRIQYKTPDHLLCNILYK